MAAVEDIQREIAKTQAFVQDRLDPLKGEVGLLREEQSRLAEEVRGLLAQQRSERRMAVLGHSTNDRVRVRGGRLDGFDMVDLAIMRSLLAAQQARPQDYEPARLRAWEDTVKRAMDSTTVGAGDELVSTEQARQIWHDVNLETAVASLFETVTMPTNPFDVPLQLGDVNWYPGQANVATTSTTPTTAKQTLTAHELVGMVPWAYELDEDAVIAMMAEVRSTLVRNVAQVLDDMLLNADTTATGNINHDGATLTTTTAGKAQYLIGFDGLVHQALVDNTDMRNNHNAAVSADMFNEIRRLMGKYGLRPSELAFITDVNTYIAAQSIEQFQTVDKLGPNATLLTGQLGAVEGIPVIVSEQLALADTDGKITSGGNVADTGRLLLVNRTQWRKGFKRELLIETARDIQKRQNVMVVSMRVAFAERTGSRSSAKHTALQYNITGV
jgi:HK97 family phage major capsid protein